MKRVAAYSSKRAILVALVVVAAVRAVGTVLVIALLIVPAAAARALSDRLAVIVPLAAAFGALAGWAGLAISYEASLHHGLRLASGGTVVLVLVACYAAAITARPVLGAVRHVPGPPALIARVVRQVRGRA